MLRCPSCDATYLVEDGIVRFSQTSDYAESFSLQWERFAQTQLDAYNGTTISRDRLRTLAGGSLDLFFDAVVYDAGCGSGRYTSVAAACGARVIASDVSLGSVRACRRNAPEADRVLGVHADTARAPVRSRSVDVALSIGVYQHTPSPLSYLADVAETVRPGARLVFWGYERRLKSLLHPKYALRPLTRRLPPETLLEAVRRAAPSLLRVSDALRRLPGGMLFSRVVPVANYRGILPLDESQRLEWAILDTFDWLSPRYDWPMTYDAIVGMLHSRGFSATRTTTDGVGLLCERKEQRAVEERRVG